MKKEQINWLREEPVELQDITIKEFKPFPVEATDLDLDNEIADTIHYLARINVLGKEIERLNNIINDLDKFLKDKIDSWKKANDDLIVKDTIYHERLAVRLIYDYLQELKGDGSND